MANQFLQRRRYAVLEDGVPGEPVQRFSAHNFGRINLDMNFIGAKNAIND